MKGHDHLIPQNNKTVDCTHHFKYTIKHTELSTYIAVLSVILDQLYIVESHRAN